MNGELTPTPCQIRALEAALREMPQAEIQTEHHFAEGVYCRQMTAEHGVMIVGKRHKHSCVNIVTEGSILVATEEGVKRIDAPAIFTSPAGTKRVGLTLQRTVWTTVHPNPLNETDLDLLESAIIQPEQQLNPPPRHPEIA